MDQRPHCAICGGDMLSVVYYGADSAPVGGYDVCTNCGPRSAAERTLSADEIRRTLLERKAS